VKHLKHCSSKVAGPCDCRDIATYPRGQRNQPPRMDRTTTRADTPRGAK